MQKMALVAAGVIFSLVAISHFIRALYAVEVLMVGVWRSIHFLSVEKGGKEGNLETLVFRLKW